MADAFTTLAQNIGVFYGLSPENGVIFLALFFSVFVGIVAGVRTRSGKIGAMSFMAVLFMFAILGWFPLWVLLLPLVVVVIYAGKGGD